MQKNSAAFSPDTAFFTLRESFGFILCVNRCHKNEKGMPLEQALHGADSLLQCYTVGRSTEGGDLDSLIIIDTTDSTDTTSQEIISNNQYFSPHKFLPGLL